MADFKKALNILPHHSEQLIVLHEKEPCGEQIRKALTVVKDKFGVFRYTSDRIPDRIKF